ncbi:MAG: 4-hydroxy-3-methylbut-2-enyl diphosphate reductase [Candidatus Woesearchaeota archaeon]
MLKKIILANPHGYCPGVERAINIVEKALEKYGRPIYVRHEIVHNEHVIKSLERKGVIFVDSLDLVPDNSLVIFSAHGVPPSVIEKAKIRNLKVNDATCPLVNKVHLEAIKYHSLGYSIILIGKKGHQEVIGTLGYAPMHLVENIEDVSNLNIVNDKKIIYLTQTTLSLDDTKEMVDALNVKFPHIQSPPLGDICFATQNRQNAVKKMAELTNLILIVGSDTSSNSKRLVETAKLAGVESHLINDKSHIKGEWFDNINAVGITSGASAPERLVIEVVNHIQELFPDAIVQGIRHKEEDVSFSLPKEL